MYKQEAIIKFSLVVLYHPKTLGAARLESGKAIATTSTAITAARKYVPISNLASINIEVETR